MRSFAISLCFVLIVASCNSEQKSIDESTTAAPDTTQTQSEFSQAFERSSTSSRSEMRIAFSDSLGNQTDLPIILIKGAKEGPVFTWLAGVHGSEYVPIIATQQLLKEIDPNELSGTLMVIPIANKGSFFGWEPYVNPLDKKNLNNAFPGNPNGTVTEQIAHYITHNIIPLTDVFLDIHGGDSPEDLLPFVCYYVDENQAQQTALAKRLSDNSGFDFSVAYPFNIDYEQPAKYAFKQAVQDGKTGVSIESGRLGLVEEEAVALVKIGVYNMLQEMSMYQNGSGPSPKLAKLSGQIYISSTVSGILYSDLKAGDYVEEGQALGYTTDEFGKVIEEYTAPQAGTVLYMIATPPINVDDTVMCISTKIESD